MRPISRCGSCLESRCPCRSRRTAAGCSPRSRQRRPAERAVSGAAAGRSAASRPPSCTCPRGNGSRATRMLSGLRPRSTRCSRTKRAHQQARADEQHQRERDFATTSAFRSRPPRNRRLTPLPESFSGSTMLRLAVCARGRQAEQQGGEHGSARLKSSTGRFRRMTTSRGMKPSGMSGTSALDAERRRTGDRVTAPPSASSGSRSAVAGPAATRLAPSEARTAISRLARRRPGEQHVRDVEAADEQQQPDRRRHACTASSGTARRCCRPS